SRGGERRVGRVVGLLLLLALLLRLGVALLVLLLVVLGRRLLVGGRDLLAGERADHAAQAVAMLLLGVPALVGRALDDDVELELVGGRDDARPRADGEPVLLRGRGSRRRLVLRERAEQRDRDDR